METFNVLLKWILYRINSTGDFLNLPQIETFGISHQRTHYIFDINRNCVDLTYMEIF